MSTWRNTFMLLLPSFATACIAEDAGEVTVQPGREVVTAIERFSIGADEETADPPLETITTMPVAGGKSPTTPELTRAIQFTEYTLQHTPGFVAAVVLNGQHGELAVYSQWKTQDRAFDSAWSVAPALAGSRAKLVDARTFEVDFSAPGEFSQFSLATTPHAHFGLFTMAPEAQAQLLELARTHAPTSIGTPGLTAINFHRSLDGGEVINFGAWTDFEGFAALLSRPGFMDGAPYWDGVASFRNIFFDVSAVVTAR
jgi:hypothetical protein